MVNHPNRSKAKKADAPEETVISIKGFDANLRCRDFQFEVGKTYECAGKIVACQNGFHGIEGYPLEVFGYYPPGTSRYAKVVQAGTLARHADDSKVASAKITIEAELHLPEIIASAVKWVFDRAKWSEGPTATKANEGVSVNGTSGAATASGYSGAATASGYSGAATASGDSGAATASGDSGAATASGDSGKVKGATGCALFLVYRDPRTGKIKHAWGGIAGQNGIEPNTWYTLGADGQPEIAS